MDWPDPTLTPTGEDTATPLDLFPVVVEDEYNLKHSGKLALYIPKKTRAEVKELAKLWNTNEQNIYRMAVDEFIRKTKSDGRITAEDWRSENG